MNRSGNSHVHSRPRKSLVTDTGIPPRATPFYLFSRNHRLFSQRDKKSDAMNTTTEQEQQRETTRNNAKQHETTRNNTKQHETTRNNTKQHETTRNNVIATRREGQ